MKNLPAFPILNEQGFAMSPAVYEASSNKTGLYGLTKLEYAAIEAMKGLVSNPEIQNNVAMGLDEVAEEAIGYAEALFEALESHNE